MKRSHPESRAGNRSEPSPSALCGHLGCHVAIRWLGVRRRRTDCCKRIHAGVLRLPSDRVVKPLHRVREEQDHHHGVELPRTQRAERIPLAAAYHRNRPSPVGVHSKRKQLCPAGEAMQEKMHLRNFARDDHSMKTNCQDALDFVPKQSEAVLPLLELRIATKATPGGLF